MYEPVYTDLDTILKGFKSVQRNWFTSGKSKMFRLHLEDLKKCFMLGG